MKKLAVFTIWMAAALAFSADAFAQETGRYELHQITYKHVDWDSGISEDRDEIFLLDTTTGDMQVYVSGTTKGKQIKYWSPAIVDETKT